jgi:outer membrane protein
LKKFSTFAATALILLSSSFFTVVHAEDYKIGAVNAVRILKQSPQAAKLRAEIEKEFAPRDRELVANQKKLKEMEDRMNRDSAIMSEQERSKLQKDIVNMRRDLKRNQDEFREDLTFRRNEELTKIQKQIIQAIQTVAKQNNYDLVLSDGVVFAGTKVDITNLVLDYLKKHNTESENKDSSDGSGKSGGTSKK